MPGAQGRDSASYESVADPSGDQKPQILAPRKIIGEGVTVSSAEQPHHAAVSQPPDPLEVKEGHGVLRQARTAL